MTFIISPIEGCYLRPLNSNNFLGTALQDSKKDVCNYSDIAIYFSLLYNRF